MSTLRNAATRRLSTHVPCRAAPPAPIPGVSGCSRSRPFVGAVLPVGRRMATSAEKRKMQRLSSKKMDPKLLEEEDELLRTVEQRAKNATAAGEHQGTPPSSDWSHPFFFLVVFPVMLTSLVVLTRDDLREELDQKGLVKLFTDWRRGPQSSNSTHRQTPQPIDVRQKENSQ